MPKYQVNFYGRMLGSGRKDSRRQVYVEAESVPDAWKKVKETYDVVRLGDVHRIPEPPPPLTAEQYTVKKAELFADIPKEFRAALAALAYDHGHSAGYDEILIHLSDYVEALRQPIKDYTERILSTANVQEKHRE